MAPNRWAIILAAGEGARIRALTKDGNGHGIPKQYWAPDGTQPMLRWTLERAGRIVPSRQIVTIVAADHRPWWERPLVDQPGRNVIVQPSNRGTAAGVLLPLLRVDEADRRAVVSVLPSDHYVEKEDVLRRAIERAFEAAERSGRVVLLGMTPESPDPDYGWIVPGGGERNGVRPVIRFVEKPGPALARSLYRRRASWSSFMLVAQVRALLSMFERAAPRMLSLMAGAIRRNGFGLEALRPLYATLPTLDFSRDLLQQTAHRLRLLEVPPCGWTDLGTPARLAHWGAPRTLRVTPTPTSRPAG